MAGKSIFDDLLGALGGASAPQGRGAAAQGGIGDLLGQLTGALGGGQGAGTTGQGGLTDLLAQLQGSLKGVTGGAGSTGGGLGGPGGLGGAIGDLLGDQKSFTKGAAAGGLMGALLGGKGTARAAGAAVIGALAWKAYQNWQAQQVQGQDGAAETREVHAFIPAPEAADQLSEKLARAMVAAAKADGQVTSMERSRILEALAQQGLGADAQKVVEEELTAPLDIGHVAALASTPEEAVQIYTASLLAVDPEAPAEKAYLEDLAKALQLAPDLVANLHAAAGA